MTPVWLGLPSCIAAAALGATLERLASGRLELSAVGLVTWIVQGLALVATLYVHPLLGVVAIGAMLAWSRRFPLEGEPARAVLPLAWLAVVVVVIAIQPPVPIAWDELVWLARARVGSGGPAVLVERGLEPGGGLVPAGYPIGAGILQSLLSCLDDDLHALTGGTGALVVICCAAFAIALAQSRIVSRRAAAVVVVTAPLLWVHLRTGMLDLPVGMLAGAFALSLHGGANGDGRLARLAPALALLLAALKDEGAMHVVVIAATSLLDRSRWRATLPHAAMSLLAAIVVVAVWRARLSAAGTTIDHHALRGFAVSALGPVLREMVRAASDVPSFGAALAMIGAAVLASLAAPRRPLERALAAAWALCVMGTLLAILVGPDAVRSFATSGTLWPRLWLQLIPLGAVIVGARWQRLPSAQPSDASPTRHDATGAPARLASAS